MGMEQDTLIYVEENDKKEAGILTNGLLNKDIKSRAYINALGAELGLKYLALENISTDKTYNLHNVHKLLEEFDISDIMLSNIHIDVRVVFDENQIFIPKSHFEYNIVPDIYLVFLLAEDSSHVKFLGFFEPKLINKNNQNSDYYFIEKEKLTAPINLKEFIENFKGNRTQSLSDDINNTAETLMVSVVDQNASKEEMKELLKYLTQSSMLRDRFIEFENFEILSYKAERSPDVTVPEEVAQNNIIDATIDDIRPTSESTPETMTLDSEESLTLPDLPAGEILEDLSDAAKNIGDAITNTEAITGAAGVAGAAGAIASGAVVAETIASAAETVGNIIEDVTNNSEQNSTQANTSDNKAEDVSENSDDVTDMFTNDSIFSSVESTNESETNENISDMSLENNSQDVIESNQTQSTDEEPAHNFEVGNPDDFFSDMVFDDIDENSSDSIETDTSEDVNAASSASQELNAEETVNFDSINQTPIMFEDNSSSQDEMEVLDISNVNAVPNDYDKNISETVEFNNIELSKEEPCYNELNAEETVPVLNMNDFTPLEPLPMEDIKAESYDMDSISLTDNMPPMPKVAKEESTLEPLEFTDMESLTPPPVKKDPEPANDGIDDASLSAELDAIPDFGSLDMGMDSIGDLSEPPLEENMENPSVENSENDVAAEKIQNLTEDDIVEQVDESMDGEEPVTDFESLANKNQNAEDEIDDAQIPSIEDFSDADIPDVIEQTDESEEQNNTAVSEDNIEQVTDSQDTENSGDAQEQDTISNDSDLQTLFDEHKDDDVEIEDFNSLNNELNKIPSIYQNNQKLPVKMIAVAALAAVLVVGGVVGFSIKNKGASSEAEPLAQEVPDETVPALPAAPDNTDILANTPEVQTLPAAQKEPVNVKKESKEAKANTPNKTANAASAVTGVTKLSWEVPDYLSYSDNIKKYLQTAGKSIKLTLSSDLLLVTEYAYSNQMRVDLQLSNDGTLKDSKVVKSSGSTQIDNIVLQTVKDTLNVIKPATGEVPTPDFRLALIINF